MLGTMEPQGHRPIEPQPVYDAIFIAEGRIVALQQPDRELTEGPPFCEVVDGMPQWMIGSFDHRLIYHEVKNSLTALKLTFSDLNGRVLYKARPFQSRRRRMRKLSGLILNRMANLAETVYKADSFEDPNALKLYQMMPVDHRAVLEHHLKEGPHIAEGYELHEHRDELLQIGLLTRVVVAGKTGSVAANMTGMYVYNAGAASPAESRKDKVR